MTVLGRAAAVLYVAGHLIAIFSNRSSRFFSVAWTVGRKVCYSRFHKSLQLLVAMQNRRGGEQYFWDHFSTSHRLQFSRTGAVVSRRKKFFQKMFDFFFSKKSRQLKKLQIWVGGGGQKAFLRGWGSFWMLGGSYFFSRGGSTPLAPPLAHLCFYPSRAPVHVLLPLTGFKIG